MRINFGDVKIGATARKYVQAALDKNWISEGSNVKEFEQKFAAKFGYKHAIATSSGTDADMVACASLYEFGGNFRPLSMWVKTGCTSASIKPETRRFALYQPGLKAYFS